MILQKKVIIINSEEKTVFFLNNLLPFIQWHNIKNNCYLLLFFEAYVNTFLYKCC